MRGAYIASAYIWCLVDIDVVRLSLFTMMRFVSLETNEEMPTAPSKALFVQ
jgi:hypothetical protein